MQPIIHKKLRKDKENNGKCPVVLQVYYNKHRKQIFTGIFVEAKFWDEEKQTVINKCPNYDLYNRVLKNKHEEIEKEYFRQSLTNGSIDLTIAKKQEKVKFYTYAISVFESLENTASKIYINKAKLAIEEFKEVAGDLTFEAITPTVLNTFQDHLFKKGLKRNTINGKYKRLKQVFKKAIGEKLTDNNPFISFKPVTYKQTKRTYLTLEEVNKLERMDFRDLNYIRDYFCISCRTGIRFGDMKNFNAKRDIILNNGVERIIIGTEKTGEHITLKLQKDVKAMICRLNKSLPSNKHTNALLKIIGQLAGIEVPLSYHQSRHSFCTNCAALGIPIEIVSKLVGHTNIRTTAIYYKITDTKLDEYMDRWAGI